MSTSHAGTFYVVCRAFAFAFALLNLAILSQLGRHFWNGQQLVKATFLDIMLLLG